MPLPLRRLFLIAGAALCCGCGDRAEERRALAAQALRELESEVIPAQPDIVRRILKRKVERVSIRKPGALVEIDLELVVTPSFSAEGAVVEGRLDRQQVLYLAVYERAGSGWRRVSHKFRILSQQPEPASPRPAERPPEKIPPKGLEADVIVKAGRYRLAGRETKSAEELRRWLVALKKRADADGVKVRGRVMADRDVPAAEVGKALDAFEQAGIRGVDFLGGDPSRAPLPYPDPGAK